MSLWSKLEDFVRGVLNIETARLRTNTVCQVVSYDATTNLVSLQPCIMAVRTDDPDSPTKQLPQVNDIPVYQFFSGKVGCTVAPAAGSYGLYVVSDRKIDNWIAQGGVVPSGSRERFDLSNGFFLPGLFPDIVDGDNGKFAVPIETGKIELRTRDRTGYVSLDGTTGQVDISGNFTVDV